MLYQFGTDLITVRYAVNLAVSLAMRRLRVGLLDLDIFGPSIPMLMGLRDAGELSLTDSCVVTFQVSFFYISLT